MPFAQTDGLVALRKAPSTVRGRYGSILDDLGATTTIFGCAKSRLARARGIFLVRRLIEFSGSRGLRLLRCRPGLGRILLLVCRLGLGLCRIFVLAAGVPR